MFSFWYTDITNSIKAEEICSIRKLILGDKAAISVKNPPTFGKLSQLRHLRIVLAIATMNVSYISHVLKPKDFRGKAATSTWLRGKTWILKKK